MDNRTKELNEIIVDLYAAAEVAYGWVCNFPETDEDITQAKRTNAKQIGDLLYADPRLEEYRKGHHTEEAQSE